MVPRVTRPQPLDARCSPLAIAHTVVTTLVVARRWSRESERQLQLETLESELRHRRVTGEYLVDAHVFVAEVSKCGSNAARVRCRNIAAQRELEAQA